MSLKQLLSGALLSSIVGVYGSGWAESCPANLQSLK